MGTTETFTYEDFERMANRQPSLEGNWIYRLTRYFFDPELKNPYPKFELNYYSQRLFLSFEDAQKFLRDHLEESLYCSIISQIPIGERETEHAAEWLFDNDCNLLDYTTTHSYGDGLETSFFGIPESRKRFKKGDMVEVRRGDEVRLAVLCSDVPDVQWCWEVYQRGLKRYPDMPYGLDYSDDSATIINGPSYHYHDHVSQLRIMKPRFQIPSDIEEEMKTWLERAEVESKQEREELDKRINKNSQKDDDTKLHSPRLIMDYYGGEFFTLTVYLSHFAGINEPVLIVKNRDGFRASLHCNIPKYADIEGYTDRLSDLNIKALQDFLEDKEQGKSRWWYLLRDWNEDDDNNPIPLDTPIPNYIKLIKEE